MSKNLAPANVEPVSTRKRKRNSEQDLLPECDSCHQIGDRHSQQCILKVFIK